MAGRGGAALNLTKEAERQAEATQRCFWSLGWAAGGAVDSRVTVFVRGQHLLAVYRAAGSGFRPHGQTVAGLTQPWTCQWQEGHDGVFLVVALGPGSGLLSSELFLSPSREYKGSLVGLAQRTGDQCGEGKSREEEGRGRVCA